MNTYQHILDKLHGFIRKYYTNELIKGSILFLAFGLLYFLFTVLIEYYLWLTPTYRSLLFWLFILVEIVFFVRYIILPLIKLFGFSKGISFEDASRIIGTHFPQIDDKLLNILQLHEDNPDSELALASIEQKSLNLQPVPFGNAIRFSSNKKYVKYLLIPVFIYFFYWLSGNINRINDSYSRIVQYQTAFVPPAPFSFHIDESTLKIIEGEPLQLFVSTTGDIIPDEVKIIFNEEDYFLKNTALGHFSYSFEPLNHSLNFYLQSGSVRSKNYKITVVPTPKITQIQLHFSYPKYVGKKNEILYNTGNYIVPEGTLVKWKVNATQTKNLSFVTNMDSLPFVISDHEFSFSKRILKPLSYTITASNSYLPNYEKLSFTLDILKDAYPRIDIKTDIDSITSGPSQFFGTLSDDYGLTKLELVYYDVHNPSQTQQLLIPIKNTRLTSFYYIFPTDLHLNPGADYEFYFKVYDNDRVNGHKSVNSALYHYHKDTPLELEQKQLQQQKKQLKDISVNLQKQETNQKKLQTLAKELKNKSKAAYKDVSRLQQYLSRQLNYREMLQRQTDELHKNLKTQPDSKNPQLNEQRRDILQRIEETKELLNEKKLLEDLQKLADKLKKEDLLDKIQKLSSNSMQKQKSLEQLLELTKRFYVEQKAQQIKEALSELAKKQENLSDSEDNSQKKQDSLNKKFDNLKNTMDDLQKANDDLKEPMPFELPKPDQESISLDMQQASEQLSKQQSAKASKSQKSAAQKMKMMANSLQSQMAASDSIEEDITLLRVILENLLNFSFKQENLMKSMSLGSYDSPDYVSHLKEQNKLKKYFEHIDDSLYVLSMRQPKLSSRINSFLANAHYYLQATLLHYPDNQYDKANSDQHQVMKSSNDLALLLSNLLDNLESKLGLGQGKGNSKGQSFSLPDIIKQQEGLAKGMAGKTQKESDKSGKQNSGKKDSSGNKNNSSKPGSKNPINEPNGLGDKEIYRIYQQQAKLRHALEQQLDDKFSANYHKRVQSVIKQMEDLEKMLLQSNVSRESIIQRMLQLKYKLLQLKEAKEKQEYSPKREAITNKNHINQLSPKQLQFKQEYFNHIEILNRQPLPLRSFYLKKIQKYFNEP